MDDDLILTLRNSDINILRMHSSVLRKFEDEFQSKVWFVEGQATDRRFIENIIFPAKVVAIHTIRECAATQGRRKTKSERCFSGVHAKTHL